jgi:hypothetical protein
MISKIWIYWNFISAISCFTLLIQKKKFGNNFEQNLKLGKRNTLYFYYRCVLLKLNMIQIIFIFFNSF